MALKRGKRLTASRVTRGSRIGALLLSTLALLVAFASHAAAVNEFSVAFRISDGADLVGIRGNQGIRTNPGTVNGVVYVHPTQMDVGSLGASFIAIGTANGAGVADCADDYDPHWTGYYDGEIAGVYFCSDFGHDNWTTGDSPSFRIERDCQLGPNVRWGVYFAGSQRACLDSGASGSSAGVAGIEVGSPDGTDRNIDAKYTSLDRKWSGGSWVAFDNNSTRVDNNYSFTRVSNTAVNTYLSPLD